MKETRKKQTRRPSDYIIKKYGNKFKDGNMADGFELGAKWARDYPQPDINPFAEINCPKCGHSEIIYKLKHKPVDITYLKK